MSYMRRMIFLSLAMSLLVGIALAQDAGQYVILNAQYGNERNHVDVTPRLRDLARADRPFHVNHESMAADPDPGHAKALRVFARGPDGNERMFEFPDNSIFDGRQFRSWNRGDWGNEPWHGDWRGGEGRFVILSAQYGSERRHVDVTDKLKELARTDWNFRVDFRTFHVDPDEGHAKVLRIFARGPNGRERMFEYRDGEVIDGKMFRGWNRGEWGGPDDRWSGRWEGEER